MAAPLTTLRAKLAERKKKRARQRRLYERTGKTGHRKAARRHGKAIKKLNGLIERAQSRLRPPSGEGKWGGCRSIINNEVVPVAKRYGVPITSRKRAANHPLSISNPSSDHNRANKNADAIDLGTYRGEALARAIAHQLGIGGYSTGNYARYTINRAGKRFSVQILWAVTAHYDHVHVGIRRG